MAYEIPQELEYKEIIAYDLTLPQLITVVISLVFTFLNFKFLNIKWLQYTLYAFTGVSCVFFMYFGGYQKLKDLKEYLVFKFRKDKSEDKVSKTLIPNKVSEDFLYTNNNDYLAIIKVNPLNFGIKNNDEKEAIIHSFRKFLNSLDENIQIYISTDKVDLSNYLDNFNSTNYEELVDDYKELLEKTISSHGIMDRNFYIIVPNKEKVNINVDVLEENLHSMNLKTRRLSFTEIKEFTKNNFTTVYKKFENYPNHFKLGNTYHKIITVKSYPRTVEAGFLDKIISLQGNFNLSIQIKPFDIDIMIIKLNRELQKQLADNYAIKSKGQYNPSLDLKIRDTKKVLERLQSGDDKLFYVSFYVDIKADNIEELNLLARKVETILSSMMIQHSKPTLKMFQGLHSTLPLADDKLKASRNVPSSALSAFFPFTSSFLEVDLDGIWLGNNKNKIPIIRDIFSLSNPNGVILAQSGGGKSFLSKLMIMRYLFKGINVLTIDPQGEYRELVEKCKGQRLEFHPKSKTIINPFDLMGHSYTQKRLSLMELMPIMLGELSEPQKSFIDKGITEAYLRKGITNDRKTWKLTPPILEDLLFVLEDYEKNALALEKITLRSLINRLNMYVNGVFSFLNKHTSIDFNNKFVCFDIGRLPRQVKPTIMFLVLDYIYTQMKKDLAKKLLVIDEAWSLLSKTKEAGYIFEIVKTCRKFNLGLLLINQEVEGLLESKAGKSVLANSAYTILLRQKPAVIKSISNTFHLSDREKNVLLSAGVGEGLLIIDDEHTELKVIASEKESKFITTNPKEMIFDEDDNDEEEVKEVEINKNNELSINTSKPHEYYVINKIKPNDIEYLERKGYSKITYKNPLINSKIKYFVKTQGQEGNIHFLLTRLIRDFLLSKGISVECNLSVKADIIFSINKSKYAIEVETGKRLHDKVAMRNKAEELNKEFGENWFFMVSNPNKAFEYKQFGTVYDTRNIKSKLDDLVTKLFPE